MTDKEKSYRSADATSQSHLSWLDEHPQIYKRKIEQKEESASYFNVGSALDTLVTGSKEEFLNNFIVSNVAAPTGQMKELVDYMWNNGYNEVDDDQLIIEGYDYVGFKKAGIDNIRDRFYKEAKQYLDFLLESEGKTIISQSEYDNVLAMKNGLNSTDIYTRYIEPEDDNVEVLFQLPVYWKSTGRNCKSLIDIVRINHQTKEIYPIDLKTTSDNQDKFMLSILKYRYYLQGAFYFDALRYYFSELINEKGYSVMRPEFLVCFKNNPDNPLVYDLSLDDLVSGIYGGTRNGLSYKGYMQLLDDLNWHESNDLWNYRREVYENGLKVQTDLFDSHRKEENNDDNENN